MSKTPLFALALALLAPRLTAQDPDGPLETIPGIWQRSVVYDDPVAAEVFVSRDLPFRNLDCGQLKADLFYPPDYEQGQLRPAVILYNGIGDLDEARQVKNSAPYQSWGRLLAATGIVAVAHNAHSNHAADDVHELIHFLESSGDRFGIDGERIGFMAVATSASNGMPLVAGEIGAHLGAAAFLYGAPAEGAVPAGLPVMLVKAGKDRADTNANIDRLLEGVSGEGVDLTFLNHPDGGHAFDLLEDDRRSKSVVKATLDFFEAKLDAERPALAAVETPRGPSTPITRAEADRLFDTGEFAAAAAAYGRYVEVAPEDGGALFRQGYCLIASGSYDEAIPIFHRTRDRGIAVPASTYNIACCYSRKGDTEEGLKWLSAAIEAGFSDRGLAESDPDLEHIRQDGRFSGILDGEDYAPAAALGPSRPAPEARSVDDLWVEAAAHFQNGQWHEAIAGYQAILRQAPEHGPANFNLGFAAIQVGAYDAAIRSFERAAEAGFRPEVCAYNLACSYSLKNEKPKAMEYLAESIALGFDNLELARTDPDLDNIRDDPMFSAILRGENGILNTPQYANPLQSGQQFQQAGRWAEATAAYGQHLESNANDFNTLFQYGFCAIRAGEYDSAIASYERLAAAGVAVQASTYNVACAYSLKGEKERAMKWLEKAIEAGFNDSGLMSTDPDLDNIRKEKGFAELLESIGGEAANTQAAAPAAPESPAHHFDFWLGEWEVYGTDGKLVGTNRIESALGGAAIQEHWKGTDGSEGVSLSMWNRNSGSWQQTWVDANNGVLEIEGGLEEGVMVMRANPVDGPHHRITWTPQQAGRVRQQWETSPDGGDSWQQVFDGLYVPRGQEPPFGTAQF